GSLARGRSCAAVPAVLAPERLAARLGACGMPAAGAARASAAAGAGFARPARTMAMQAGISAIRPGYLEEVASPAMRPATTARDGVTVSRSRTAHRQGMGTKNG